MLFNIDFKLNLTRTALAGFLRKYFSLLFELHDTKFKLVSCQGRSYFIPLSIVKILSSAILFHFVVYVLFMVDIKTYLIEICHKM